MVRFLIKSWYHFGGDINKKKSQNHDHCPIDGQRMIYLKDTCIVKQYCELHVNHSVNIYVRTVSLFKYEIK